MSKLLARILTGLNLVLILLLLSFSGILIALSSSGSLFGFSLQLVEQANPFSDQKEYMMILLEQNPQHLLPNDSILCQTSPKSQHIFRVNRQEEGTLHCSWGSVLLEVDPEDSLLLGRVVLQSPLMGNLFYTASRPEKRGSLFLMIGLSAAILITAACLIFLVSPKEETPEERDRRLIQGHFTVSVKTSAVPEDPDLQSDSGFSSHFTDIPIEDALPKASPFMDPYAKRRNRPSTPRPLYPESPKPPAQSPAVIPIEYEPLEMEPVSRPEPPASPPAVVPIEYEPLEMEPVSRPEPPASPPAVVPIEYEPLEPEPVSPSARPESASPSIDAMLKEIENQFQASMEQYKSL